MMKSRLRLRQSEDFQRVRRYGKVIRHSDLMLSYANNDLKHNRYGFVTGKKLGNAVTRNRVKRRLSEATHRLHPMLRQGFDIVIVTRPAVVQQPFADLLRIVGELYRRASLIEDNSHA